MGSKAGKILKNIYKNYGGQIIALIAMVIVVSILSPHFLTAKNLFSLVRQIATMILVTYAMSFALISGNIDLSVGSTIAFTSTILVAAIAKFNLNFFLAALLAILMGMLVGMINGAIIAKTNMNPFIVTLGTQNIVRGLAYFTTGGLAITCKSTLLYAMGKKSVLGIPILIWIVIFATIICSLLLNRTVFGRNVIACGGNREAASYCGINTKKITFQVYLLGGILVGIGGVMMAARMYSGQPSISVGLEGDAIGAAVLGGVAFSGGSGTITGAILGALIIGVLQNGMNLLDLNSFWQYVVKGLVLLIAVYIDTVKKNRKN